VQIDIDPLLIGQRRAVEVGVVGDPRLVLEALAAELRGRTREGWYDVAELRRRKRATLAERAEPVLAVIDDLRAALSDDAIVVDDLTLVGYWMPVMLDTYLPRTLIHPGTYGTLGYALPAAVGAKLACPSQPVVAVCGDGGFLFTLQELATARALDLDLVVMVFNDNAFGAIRQFQDREFGGRHIGAALENPDFVKLGEAFGARSARVEPKNLGAAVRRAQAAGGLWLLEIPFAPRGSVEMVPWMP
jgi:thiamine pyrophosphate-dependent acetolactate synthase large subunit-like protein